MSLTTETASAYGGQLRYWRHRRGLSQLRLATEADISSRHLSFMETGRSRPSRDMVVHLAAVMEVPLRHQNTMLTSAGYAQAYRARDLSGAEMAPVTSALNFMLEKHEPYPAVVLDRLWSVVMANRPMQGMIGLLGLDPGAAPGEPPNFLRACFDPAQIRPSIVNWETVAWNIIGRVHREIAHGGDDAELKMLLDEMLAYPDVPVEWRSYDPTAETDPMITVELDLNGTRLRLFTLISTFGTPNDITLQELRIETMFPADEPTDRILKDLAKAESA